MNYISKEQLARSLASISDVHPFFGISFLAFKKAQVPVGTTMSLNFSAVADDILESHYRPVSSFEGLVSSNRRLVLPPNSAARPKSRQMALAWPMCR